MALNTALLRISKSDSPRFRLVSNQGKLNTELRNWFPATEARTGIDALGPSVGGTELQAFRHLRRTMCVCSAS